MISKIGLLSFFLAASVYAQPYLNLDFETVTRGQLWSWSGCVAQYQCAPDNSVFQSGAQSLRIRSTNTATSTSLGVSSQYFPMELVRGHHVRVSGWMKTDTVVGYAAVWWRVDGANGFLTLDNMSQTGPRGTTDWKQYSFDRDVSPDAVDVVFGVFLSGTGTAWFDGLEVDIDGVPFNQGAAPNLGPPTSDQLNWVTSNAIPVAGVDPTLPLDDLAPLQALIGDAHVVGLGEDTHGTSEFFRMKHRIIEYLASQMGFTVFAIEANMPEAYAMNDYVLNGNGDPKQFLKGMYFWTWNTQEVLDMVQWMRNFNQSGQGQIQFTGFDMQTPDVAEKIAQDFVAQADAGYTDQLSRVYKDVQIYEKGIPDFGLAVGTFPLSSAAGKHVHYTGYIKTQGVNFGYAGLWWRVDGPNRTTLAFDNMSTRGVTGTKDWAQYSIDLDVPANAVNINFGVIHPGSGTAWFEDLAVTLNGTPSSASLDFATGNFSISSSGGNDFALRLDSSVVRVAGEQSLRSAYIGQSIPSKDDLVSECNDVVTYLQGARDQYLGAGLAPTDVDWAIQNARVVAQYADLQRNPNVRDPDMATNAEWILSQQPPGTKIVLWAHNGHVARTAGAMGSYLAAQYGEDYRVLGFAFHDGQYNAVGPQGLRPYTANPSFPGSDEYIFHTAGIAPFILDLRSASLDDPGSAWLKGPIMSRSIGAVPVDGFFVTNTLTHDYDALIFFEHSTPSSLLPF